MPKNPAEVNTLLDQLKAARDKWDADGIELAAASEVTAAAVDAEAALLDGQVPVIRQHRDFVIAPRDEVSRSLDNDKIKALVNQSGVLKQAAAKLRLNGARMPKLGHDRERQADAMICVYCVALYDKDGILWAANHTRHYIEDRNITDKQGAFLHVDQGLRTLLASGEAELDPSDGRLIVRGGKVGKN